MRLNPWWLGAVIIVLLLIIAWQMRGSFYIWRMQQTGFVPYGLECMKEKALPLLYRKADRLDDDSEARRAGLLGLALQKIRYRMVASQLGSAQYADVLPALHPVDSQMLERLTRCYRFCDAPEQRIELLTFLSRMDFRMKAAFFCEVFDEKEYPGKSFLASFGSELITMAWEEKGRSYYWEGKSEQEIQDRQRQMKKELQTCVIPIVRHTWERIRRSPEEEWPEWSYYFETAYSHLPI